MSFAALLAVALALSVDNFSIAVAVGASRAVRDLKSVLTLPVIFGVCSFVAPLVGWLAGSTLVSALHGVGGVLAFTVLAYVGWRTLSSAWTKGDAGMLDASSLRTMLVLGVATSGDSLAVGFGLAMTDTNIALASVTIGAVTGLLSLAGMLIGAPLGRALGAITKVAAGLVLMLVGVHALVAS